MVRFKIIVTYETIDDQVCIDTPQYISPSWALLGKQKKALFLPWEERTAEEAKGSKRHPKVEELECLKGIGLKEKNEVGFATMGRISQEKEGTSR